MYQKGHQTSARYAKGRSELFDDIKIKSNNTHLIIGKVLSVSKVELKNEKPTDLDFESLNGVNVSGLSDYYSVEKLSSLAYAKDK